MEIEVVVVFLTPVTQPEKLCQDIVEGRTEDDVRGLRNHPQVSCLPCSFSSGSALALADPPDLDTAHARGPM